ncbi:MAG TPA: HEAT repeat domain-containing protein [Desulfobacterales bacterium]|nr:HEAT repeat domain-containing protein [Desulfobacterales bacterium]
MYNLTNYFKMLRLLTMRPAEEKRFSIFFFCMAIVILLAIVILPGKARGVSQSDESQYLSVVHLEKNLFSVKAKNVPLKRVLEEIAKETGIVIIRRTSTDVRVSADYSALPLAQVLSRLTRDFGRVFVYASQSTAKTTSEIKAVFIYAKSDMALKESEETAKQDLASRGGRIPESGSLYDLLNAGAPELRLKAVELLAESEDESAIDHLTTLLLTDNDRKVRVSAAGALGSLGGVGAMEALSRALRDTDAEVRLNALTALGGLDDDEIAVDLIRTLDDNDAVVRAIIEEATGGPGNE